MPTFSRTQLEPGYLRVVSRKTEQPWLLATTCLNEKPPPAHFLGRNPRKRKGGHSNVSEGLTSLFRPHLARLPYGRRPSGMGVS